MKIFLIDIDITCCDDIKNEDDEGDHITFFTRVVNIHN